jgi:hypothetical protein
MSIFSIDTLPIEFWFGLVGAPLLVIIEFVMGALSICDCCCRESTRTAYHKCEMACDVFTGVMFFLFAMLLLSSAGTFGGLADFETSVREQTPTRSYSNLMSSVDPLSGQTIHTGEVFFECFAARPNQKENGIVAIANCSNWDETTGNVTCTGRSALPFADRLEEARKYFESRNLSECAASGVRTQDCVDALKNFSCSLECDRLNSSFLLVSPLYSLSPESDIVCGYNYTLAIPVGDVKSDFALGYLANVACAFVDALAPLFLLIDLIEVAY